MDIRFDDSTRALYAQGIPFDDTGVACVEESRHAIVRATRNRRVTDRGGASLYTYTYVINGERHETRPLPIERASIVVRVSNRHPARMAMWRANMPNSQIVGILFLNMLPLLFLCLHRVLGYFGLALAALGFVMVWKWTFDRISRSGEYAQATDAVIFRTLMLEGQSTRATLFQTKRVYRDYGEAGSSFYYAGRYLLRLGEGDYVTNWYEMTTPRSKPPKEVVLAVDPTASEQYCYASLDDRIIRMTYERTEVVQNQ